MSDTPKIPKLELEKFTFSPPGPMGWNMAEYEQLLDNNPDELVLNESTVNSQLESLQGIRLVEFSLSGELKAKEYEEKDSSVANQGLEGTKELAEEKFVTDKPDLTEEQITEEENTGEENTGEENTEEENTGEENTGEENTEEENTGEENTEEEIIEEPKPKTKVTIIVSDNALKNPWITPSMFQAKKNSK